ncbi:hypothetical protein C0993_001399 [Termitomyces sp. T159_Od127]|nr:hypothetical protein C0993_001399 [Termitomyces sp. T159_Od127]
MSLFGGGTPNPYEDIVAKTTDENLTTENWELILNLCDKVLEEGQQGAHNVIASILKRLAHRNPNVQLYALSLTESLSKNCDVQLHREIASKAFTQGLEKLVTDRTTHEKVRKRALSLIWTWTAEFENDPTLGVMEDCYNALRAKNYKFEPPEEDAPPAADDEIRRKEEEELQRVLEMSIQDKGGRGQWSAYTPSGGSSSGIGSGSTAIAGNNSTKPSVTAPKYQSGYVPARTPSPQPATPLAQQAFHQPQPQPQAQIQAQPRTQTPSQSYSRSSYHSEPQTQTTTAASTSAASTSTSSIVTRVRALHTFEPTEPGELGFEKGDVIKVVDRGYKDWWRGQLKGRTGIFPVNYVEPLPDPTPAELAKEAEQEAAVFAQAVNVEKLLNMLRALDPTKDNLADNEEIQELYRSSMALRPKIVKLIDKYSQKRADLVSMNETFVRARTIFDRMMEESLARHTAVYEQQPYRVPSYHQPNVNAGRGYGWSPGPQQAGYASFPSPVPAPVSAQPSYDAGTIYAQQQAHAAAQVQAATAAQSTSIQHGTSYAPQVGYAGQQPNVVYGLQGSPAQTQIQPQAQSKPQRQSPQLQPQAHLQAQTQPQPQPQAQIQSQHQQAQSQPQVQQQQPELQVSQSPEPTAQTGPPYVFDPSMTYSDQNVQAWAQYYARGGRDPTGAVYFISVPGVTSVAPLVAGQQQHVQAQQQQDQPQQQQQNVQPNQTKPAVHEQQPQQVIQPIQPQPQTSPGGANSRSSVDTLPYPGENLRPTLAPTLSSSSDLSYVHSPIQPNQNLSYPLDTQQEQPQQSQYQQPEVQPQTQSMAQEFAPSTTTVARAASIGSTLSPTSTPTWLLPKKSTPPPRLGHGGHGNGGAEGHWS